MFYPDKYNYCSLTKNGKRFSFLIGPYSHLFARKNYGIDEFVGDDNTCPSGIEQSGSILKSTKFFTDILASAFVQNPGLHFERITDATMALFQDTGHYLCNWSMAQPLVWGNPESQIGGKPIKDFALGSPQLVFPKQYLKEKTSYVLMESDPDFTGFNFKYGGIAFGDISTPSNCDGEWAEYCKGKDYYNPLNKKFISKYAVFEYNLFRFPWSSCENGMAMYPGDGICRKYICDRYDSFTLITPNLKDANGNQTNITCTKDDPNKNITVLASSYSDAVRNITCVHPELFCRTVKLHEMHFVRDPFDPDISVTQLDDPYGESSTKTDANTNTTSDSESDSKSKSNNKIKIIVPCVVCGVIVIAIIVIVIIFIIKKRKSNTDISEDESINNLKDDEV
ncbi:hypothetical protein TVAG_030920 [Trichomonas vaginalis G3]|uniref:GP63-like n=1 Tax=Trichomonas vaginalis (strain ATCC PRA-98 / G3) TaxID=412133 RepID=A2EYK0_TRIV3|nr:regulation of choline O-acetyltransferase protein [Trichomonas vaginalis G3]EAY02276.1 hypothetical protein TVAG_030920 [Trichomonas vaginalis G3]KAI5522897.1 regulation of choline O-acetyltransferase protein [Trichomonas vaginalis G3]|eukprot:XP_001314593.1 hypothetical protein [Trichomonas vaginalis G3]